MKQHSRAYLEAILVRVVAQSQSNICLNLVHDSRCSSQSRFALPILKRLLHQSFEPEENRE